ncbi:MAG: DinB family protein, partial [Ktedonobacteraceae bacterium]
AWDQPGAPAKSAAELISGLEATWQMIQHALTRWTPADLDYIFEGTHDGEDYHLTRQWIIWHVIEHDLHHGGEISFTLVIHNITSIDI